MASNHPDDGGFLIDDNSPASTVPVAPPTAEERGVSPHSSDATATSVVDPTEAPLPKIVKLDVGGFTFTTSRATLCRVAGSMISAMFSGRHSMEELKSEDGSYFIDRDGSHFRHILNYLRSGGVITLPTEPVSKEELAVEADYYGLEGLVKAIRMPKTDYMECVPDEVLAHWEAENQLRAAFVDGTAKGFSDPFRGLIPLFPVAGKEDECIHSMPLKYNPNSDILQQSKGALFLNTLRADNADATTPVTVKSLEEFRTNFNKEWPNILHRLNDVLLEESVIMAGGSVLRALTASKGIRTSQWWDPPKWGRPLASDIDLFLYGCDPENANRISRRIFGALAGRAEKWAVVRSRGVCNIYHHNDAVHGLETKVQIVLRIYDSPTEVLVGFDVDCCCCAYDGRNVWVCPRWVPALQAGANVLNPLHAWPNLPSYERRLAKYSFRGFSVLIPGIDKGRVNYDLILRSKLGELKGLARFVKISSEMDSAPPYKTREYANEEDEGAVEDPNWEEHFLHHERPRNLSEIQSLRVEEGTLLEDTRLVEQLNLDYDDTKSRVVIPSVYLENNTEHWRRLLRHIMLRRNNFPISPESRDRAWEEILDAGENHPKGVERRLVDAWETGKRSREYLNGLMDKYDLDNVYYMEAYKEDLVDK